MPYGKASFQHEIGVVSGYIIGDLGSIKVFCHARPGATKVPGY